MSRGHLGSLLRHRAVVVTALLLLAWGAFYLWGEWSGAQKLTASRLAQEKQGRLHLTVTLNFAPEAFHMMRFQSAGRLIEVRGATAYLMDVPIEEARSLARQYWVREIQPWQGR